MSLFTKSTELRDQVVAEKAQKERGEVLENHLLNQFDAINSMNYFNVLEVEKLMLEEQQQVIKSMTTRKTYPTDIPRFSPSGANKCERELFYKALKMKQDEQTNYPFQKRWTRNSTAVHGAVQKQLLESEFLLSGPPFKVMRLDNGLPAWENNIEGYKVIEHNGQKFVVFGMCDGILEYKDGSKVGFEYKTKSNSVAQIKQTKEIQIDHKMQLVAYSILFGVDEWLVTYESVAKDKWSTNEAARPDIKIFYHKVADWERKQLLDKWARIAENISEYAVPEGNYSKCLFCPFKTKCAETGF